MLVELRRGPYHVPLLKSVSVTRSAFLSEVSTGKKKKVDLPKGKDSPFFSLQEKSALSVSNFYGNKM